MSYEPSKNHESLFWGQLDVIAHIVQGTMLRKGVRQQVTIGMIIALSEIKLAPASSKPNKQDIAGAGTVGYTAWKD